MGSEAFGVGGWRDDANGYVQKGSSVMASMQKIGVNLVILQGLGGLRLG